MLAGVDLIVVVLLVALIYYRGPVTDLLITWLWADGRDGAALANLVTGVLWGLIPTGVLLIVLLTCSSASGSACTCSPVWLGPHWSGSGSPSRRGRSDSSPEVARARVAHHLEGLTN